MQGILKRVAFGMFMAAVFWNLTGCELGDFGFPNGEMVIEYEVTGVSIKQDQTAAPLFPYILTISIRWVTDGGGNYPYYSDKERTKRILGKELVTINGKPLNEGIGFLSAYLDFLPQEGDLAVFNQEWFFATPYSSDYYPDNWAKVRIITESMPITMTLESIAVTSLPAKTVYLQGEFLDLKGLVVTGTYTDGATKAETVSLFNIGDYNANTPGEQTLKVWINNLTATFTVTVNPVELESIAVTSLPARTVYESGEPLDISGLVVTGTYSNGTTKAETVGLSGISGYNADTLGPQTLTVTVGGMTVTFDVEVQASA
jgi:hypothetical protein